ncbi:MAG: RidA family protein [Gemmatimonadales bacterium]|nr:RidA family protein [Gemmatimonadales bacterium]
MEFVSTDHAPTAIGPYSQATIVDNFVYTAGQIALDPASGEIIAGGVAEQTTRVFANLRAILAAAGTDLAHVVKTTVFLTDMADFQAMNVIYAEAFGDHRPARSTVAVSGLPRNVIVEIEVIARRVAPR